MKNPWLILLSIVGGIVFGIFAGDGIVSYVAPIGTVYVALLQMCVVPIVLTAILSSIAELIRSPSVTQRVLWKFTVFLFLTLFATSTLGVFTGTVTGPGVVEQDQRNILGQIVESSSVETDYGVSLDADADDEPVNTEEGVLIFLQELIPKNIFASLVNSEILRIVFFAILFGIAIAYIKKEQSDYIISLSTGIYLSFNKIIAWTMYLLPIGLFVLVAEQVKSTGITALLASIKLIISFYGLGLLLIVVNTVIISVRSRLSIVKVLKACLSPIFVAFSTRSSIAAIPASLETLTEGLNSERLTTKFVFPLCITLGRYGNVLYFALAGVFGAQLYGISLEIPQILLLIVTAVAAGIGTAGATGFATLSMIAIAVRGLGLPTETLLLILFAIDPIVDPMRSLLIVHTNIMFTTLVSPISTSKRKKNVSDALQNFTKSTETVQ